MSVDERFPLTSERIMLAVDRLVNAQISQRLCNGGGAHASPHTLQQIADEVRTARVNLTMALDDIVPARGVQASDRQNECGKTPMVLLWAGRQRDERPI